MSTAGIRSNRGDAYQTLVAFDWALTVLSDDDYQWLEIDSITYSVDDVVVGKTDGTQIACQCKKNQTDFHAWSLSDLADELEKASRLLNSNQNAEARFYSRNNFGDIAKLREHSTTQNDEASYLASLGKRQKTTDTSLAALLSKHSPGLSTFGFLRRTTFVTTDELDRMKALLRERLRNMVSNSDNAFDALWTRLDHLGARFDGGSKTSATQHRLTKDDLQTILQKTGAMLVPPLKLSEVRSSFSETSAIGRSWRRDIAGRRISSPIVHEILEAIDAKKKSILLTGLPGSGKTCAMLALQEELEARVSQGATNIVPLFIQSREFADLVTSADRQSQGLSEQWVERAGRMAEAAHVVVIIDSLDVLSIARDHRVLTYFLAQIDRLLLIPNITVVTACRDFDRHYDRRIAEREWDVELKCPPLDWIRDVAPLLEQLGITTTTIDADTRSLITNPRELALFVELAQKEGSFNVVTSQGLAQRYLDTIVRDNSSLGDEAIKAIEAVASEMLKRRSMVVPHQRFAASSAVRRELSSLNVLQDTQDGNLMFGHQTLLDVLVISGAIRNGSTLNSFIIDLPPVPFVRPSIRSFVAQLALGDRREFRKQLRTVLTGSAGFHIRRLIAESFAEQIPQDDDWPLLRDLREKHRDVFQVIYTTASTIDWHRFWLRHLAPFLIYAQDREGLQMHMHRVSHWSSEDTGGVLSFWTDALSLDWMKDDHIADQIGHHLSRIKSANMALVSPLLDLLLKLPRSEHSSLGRVIANCLDSGTSSDEVLWRYVTEGINDNDLNEYRFDQKLRCNTHEFGDRNKDFFAQRMQQSQELLGLAIDSIEHWSKVRTSRYGETRKEYRCGFLNNTSYDASHSQRDIGMGHSDDMSVLLNAVEGAILHHAKKNSEWWLKNRHRLCFNKEGALLYFSMCACTATPSTNLDLIGQMFCDQKMLEFTSLSFELGTLLQAAFPHFSASLQDTVSANILTAWSDFLDDERRHFAVLEARAKMIVAIPCFLRSLAAQSLIDEYEKMAGLLIRQPEIHSRGGVVSAPFSFNKFLEISDSGVLRIVDHYNGYSDQLRRGEDFLTGGEREVGWQLREAASRHPTRFLRLLSIHWTRIPEKFRDDLMEGVATYLAYKYGNLQSNGQWLASEEPDPLLLASKILDELECHPQDWWHQRSAAKALEACANVIQDAQMAERLIFLVLGFDSLYEDDPIKGEKVDLIGLGINMAKGDVTEALMILANNFLERGAKFPDLLIPALSRFARSEHPAIRALILRRLPFLQSKDLDLGWDLFRLSTQPAHGLWAIAEPCLYYSYHDRYEIVRPILSQLRMEGIGSDLKTWGRISALASMARHIELPELLADLNALCSTEAWEGAASVWSNVENIQLHRDQCYTGIAAGLTAGQPYSEAVAKKTVKIFREKETAVSVPIDLIRQTFSVLKDEGGGNHIYGLHEWLNATAQRDPETALAATEIYLAYVSRAKPYLYDDENSLTQLMTRLFAESEEREESDGGAMLQRVVAIQDTLLSQGLNSLVDWLKAAERP